MFCLPYIIENTIDFWLQYNSGFFKFQLIIQHVDIIVYQRNILKVAYVSSVFNIHTIPLEGNEFLIYNQSLCRCELKNSAHGNLLPIGAQHRK